MVQRKQSQKKTSRKKTDMTVSELAKVVSKGFNALEERIDETEVRLSQQINGINNRLDDLALNRATRDELQTVNKRVDRVEKKVGLKSRR
ncbi:MAG: hypothetical protein WDZ82_02060 [Candidatus Paceibacterota bacterium]